MAETESAQSVDPSSDNLASVELLDHFDLIDRHVGVGEETPSGREGLPSSYRMRHDEHYVEELLARPAAPPIRVVPVRSIAAAALPAAPDLSPLAASIRRHGVLQPLLVRSRDGGLFELIAGARRLAAAKLAGLADVPCIVHQADDDGARSIAEAERLREQETARPAAAPIDGTALASAVRELAERLGAIESCAELIRVDDRPLRERIALDLLRAEARRCAWLAEALLVIAREPLLARTEAAASALLERGLALVEPERRLAGVEVSAEIPRAPLAVRGDQRLLATALALATAALVAIAGRAPTGRVKARIHADAGRSAALFEISQDHVAVPAWALERFFDAAWHDRPGGAMLGAGLLGARRVAELHGGRLEVSATGRSGCALTMAVPCG